MCSVRVRECAGARTYGAVFLVGVPLGKCPRSAADDDASVVVVSSVVVSSCATTAKHRNRKTNDSTLNSVSAHSRRARAFIVIFYEMAGWILRVRVQCAKVSARGDDTAAAAAAQRAATIQQ